MNEILAYYRIFDTLATSGQPTSQQFSAIASDGYEIVINLALPTSKYAIANEREIVSSLGMSYVHIPVDAEKPKVSDVLDFFSVMQSFQNKKVWVHCALNMRVSCFVYLYRVCVLHHSESESQFPMTVIWEPPAAWQELMDSVRKIHVPPM